jgi:hypothetical protein
MIAYCLYLLLIAHYFSCPLIAFFILLYYTANVSYYLYFTANVPYLYPASIIITVSLRSEALALQLQHTEKRLSTSLQRQRALETDLMELQQQSAEEYQRQLTEATAAASISSQSIGTLPNE